MSFNGEQTTDSGELPLHFSGNAVGPLPSTGSGGSGSVNRSKKTGATV